MASPSISPDIQQGPAAYALDNVLSWLGSASLSAADFLKNAAGITVTKEQQQAIDNQTAADIAAAKGSSADVARGVSEVNASIDYSRNNATCIGIDSIVNTVKDALPNLPNIPALPDTQTLAYVAAGIAGLIIVLLVMDLLD
jgi:hypothetical protein